MSHVPPTGSGQSNPLTNGSGTILATARPFGSAGPVNLSNPSRDHDTICKVGNDWMPIATLIKMGVLNRNGNTLTENYAMRMGGGGVPRRFPATYGGYRDQFATAAGGVPPMIPQTFGYGSDGWDGAPDPLPFK